MTEKPDVIPEETVENTPDETKTEESGKQVKKPVKKSSKKKEKKRKIKPSHVIICLLILAIIGLLIYFLWPAEEIEIVDGPVPMGGRGTVAIPENIDELMQAREEPPPGGHYITTMNNTWAFDRWNVPSTNAYIENDIRNEFTVYFDLSLEEDGRLVYSSPYIPIGATLREFSLDRMVPRGEHPAIVTYFLVDDDGEEVSRVSVRVTLTITR